MVPVGPRSLTVTALSIGEDCFASSWLKFQLNSATGCAGSYMKETGAPGQALPIHGSLKRKRGVGEHPESFRLGCLPRLRLLRPSISLPSNPSLPLQASSSFALVGDLEVRFPNEVSA